MVDRASFINTLLLFQLDTLLFSFYVYNFSLHVSDRLVHHRENQITLAASGTFPSFVVISCVEKICKNCKRKKKIKVYQVGKEAKYLHQKLVVLKRPSATATF